MEKLVEWTVLAGENEVLGENLPRRHFSHHYSHLPDAGANPGRRDGKSATNGFSYGAAINSCIHENNKFSVIHSGTYLRNWNGTISNLGINQVQRNMKCPFIYQLRICDYSWLLQCFGNNLIMCIRILRLWMNGYLEGSSGVSVEIRTDDFPNTVIEYYRYIKLFDRELMIKLFVSNGDLNFISSYYHRHNCLVSYKDLFLKMNSLQLCQCDS
jgi:hypothetical protein